MLLAAVPTFTRSMYVRKYIMQSRNRTMPGAVGLRIFMCVTSGLCAAQIFHRFLCAAGAVRDSCHRESHFHSGERSHQRQIVQIAQVADTKYFASELGKA